MSPLRRKVKTAAALACHWTGAARVVGRASGRARGPLVLAYHRVVTSMAEHPRSIPAMLVTTATLERHLDWVARRYRVTTLDEVGAALAAGEPGDGLAAITFDDGYDDVYENALPLLKRKGLPAAVFVVTDLVGTSRAQRHDRLHSALRETLVHARAPVRALSERLAQLGLEARLPRMRRDVVRMVTALLHGLTREQVERLVAAMGDVDRDATAYKPLSWERLCALQRSGVTIASHSRSHALLPLESRETVTAELQESRAVLEERLRIPIRHFAYPSGCFDRPVVEAVAAAGYRFAFTTCRCRDPRRPLLTIPRRGFWEGSCLAASGGFSSEMMSCYVNGLFDVISGCRERHGERVPA